MIETDYINGQLLVKRGDKVVNTFKFKEFVSAKQFKPVNDLRNKLVRLANGQDTKTTEAEADEINIEFYTKTTTIGLENPMSFEDACDILTVAELAKLSEEILIFLVNWSSIEAVKQYAQQSLETIKNETKP
mgnify:FL=1|jgi:hypothetical protein